MRWFRRTRTELTDDDDTSDDQQRAGYTPSMTERMKRLDNYSYEFDESEAAEVEARIRRMFYGAHVEE